MLFTVVTLVINIQHFTALANSTDFDNMPVGYCDLKKIIKNTIKSLLCEFWDFHGSDVSSQGLLGCDIM
jgi:hypothetical protein